jgi:16S rRNA (cytosine1402-N4)-methyltransferase
MTEELLHYARPASGNVVVDCTFGSGGHARAVIAHAALGKLIALDIDDEQMRATSGRLIADGVGASSFTPYHRSFVDLLNVLECEGVQRADVLIADLGVSSAQFDDPQRGLNYKAVGPLDMRLDRSLDRPTGARLLAALPEDQLALLLASHADEPHAAIIACALKQQPIETSHALERTVRRALGVPTLGLSKQAIKDSVRRTFQALRIEVNQEAAALDALLALLPDVLAAGGRAVIITFHVGEERRVASAFSEGLCAGIYSAASDGGIRPSRKEILGNRRVSSAKLHWAVRAAT